MKRLNTQAALFGVLILSACSSIEAVCPITAFPAIEVEVRYASTEEPAWWGTQGFVQDGNFIDSLFTTSEFAEDSTIPFLLAAAFDRPGTYDVTLERNGFEPVQFDDVTATLDAECSQVIPVRLQVRLVPVPMPE